MAAPPLHPNLITTLRLPLAPAAVACMAIGGTEGLVAAAVLALVLEVTDLADGYVARRYNVITDFGKLYDPFSDAFSRFTLFLGLYHIEVAQLWMILVIFYRDSSVSFFRSVAATRNMVISARPSGKIKAVVQGVGTQIVFLTLVAAELGQDASWAELVRQMPYWTMLIITVVTGASFFDYLAGAWPVLREAWNARSED